MEGNPPAMACFRRVSGPSGRPCKGHKMDKTNAFVNKPAQPTRDDLIAALGSSSLVWQQLLIWFEEQGVHGQEWKSVSLRYGWSLRLKLKKRTIVYLSPCHGCFRAAFVLGDRAVAATRKIDLPKRVAESIAAAPRYGEVTGIRLVVKEARDMAPIRLLARVKLDH